MPDIDIVERLLARTSKRKKGLTDDAAAEIVTLRDLLRQARVFVEGDALMMADLTRFSPLPPNEQAKHDSTPATSEILLPKIDAILPPHQGAKSCPPK